MGKRRHIKLSNLPKQKITSSIGIGVCHQLQTPKLQVSARKPVSTPFRAAAGFLTIGHSVRSRHFPLTTNPFWHQDKCLRLLGTCHIPRKRTMLWQQQLLLHTVLHQAKWRKRVVPDSFCYMSCYSPSLPEGGVDVRLFFISTLSK